MKLYCPMCGKLIIQDGQHLRSVAELKNGVYICNDGKCIRLVGGWDKVKAYSGLTTTN